MSEVTFNIGNLVKLIPNQKVGIVTHSYGRDLFDVLFGCGNIYTCFLKDLEAL